MDEQECMYVTDQPQFDSVFRMALVVLMVVVAEMAKQIPRIRASGVHQKTLNRTGLTYTASLEHVKLRPVCMVCA